jgi:NAD(P)-dependent dehydrogenase (short-subunit alcohol dehydrogenase family)
LEVNMISPLVVIQAFAPLLGTDKKRQGPAGRVVNISSSTAKVAIPLLGAYSSSKSGLEGMSDVLRRELMLFGIDVIIIEPGNPGPKAFGKEAKLALNSEANLRKQTEINVRTLMGNVVAHYRIGERQLPGANRPSQIGRSLASRPGRGYSLSPGRKEESPRATFPSRHAACGTLALHNYT